MRLVVKLGTGILAKDSGILHRENIRRLADEIGKLLDDGNEVIIISSGAIAAGCGISGCSPKNLNLMEKQAMASIGQTDLMDAYKDAFSKQNRDVGQILITAVDLSSRRSYLNIRNTLCTLLKMKVVPVVNENDTVAVEEIKFGDNDRIAAIITAKVDADKLIILTDVDGLISSEGKLIKEVKKIDKKIIDYAQGKGSVYSAGGMITKINAAKTVSKLCGVNTYIANGKKVGVLQEIAKGGNPGTVFIGGDLRVSHRKRWIACGPPEAGSLLMDKGAVNAVRNKNSSLLAVGIKKVQGNFNEGDLVCCNDEAGNIVAKGLVNYSSDNLKKIIGKKSSSIEKILGYKDYDEVIHRDNMVLL